MVSECRFLKLYGNIGRYFPLFLQYFNLFKDHIFLVILNSLPNDRLLDWSRLKAFVDINKCSLKTELLFGICRKHCGKRRKLPRFESNTTFDLRNHLVNPFPNKPWFLRVCSTSRQKTLWEKEKLLVRSNFSFSHSVFYLFGELSVIFIKSEIVFCNLF